MQATCNRAVSRGAVNNVCRDKDDPEYCWNGTKFRSIVQRRCLQGPNQLATKIAPVSTAPLVVVLRVARAGR